MQTANRYGERSGTGVGYSLSWLLGFHTSWSIPTMSV